MFALKNILYVVVVGLLIQCVRIYFSSCLCQSETRLDGKTVLISGGNSGIGLETGRILYNRGARVILACRRADSCKSAVQSILSSAESSAGQKASVASYKLDLASIKSIREFTQQYLASESRLDILINNAGVMALENFTKTVDGFEMQFGVNHLGHFLLTRELLGRIEESTPSRVILVSSYFHVFASTDFSRVNEPANYGPWSAYAQSKLANVLFARELARRLKGKGVVVTSLHPGAVATGLGRHIIPTWLEFPLSLISGPFIKTPVEGAQTSVCCAIDDTIDPSMSGAYFSECQPSYPLAAAVNDSLAEELWTLSEKLLEGK